MTAARSSPAWAVASVDRDALVLAILDLGFGYGIVAAKHANRCCPDTFHGSQRHAPHAYRAYLWSTPPSIARWARGKSNQTQDVYR